MNIYRVQRSSQVVEKVVVKTEQLATNYELSRRDMRGLLDNAFFISPHLNKVIANFAKVPIIITQEKVLILDVSQESKQFAAQICQLLTETAQTDWELSIIEALMLFVNKCLNNDYLSLIRAMDSYQFQEHTQIQNLVQKLISACHQMDTLLRDLIENEDTIPFLCFANQDVLNNQQSSSSTSHLSVNTNQSHLSSSFNQLQNARKKHKDQFLVQNIEDVELPVSVEQITDLLEVYKLQFNNLLVETKELKQKMGLKIIEQNMKLEIQRSYIMNFQINQKIINVSATFSSLIGQFFGMNLLNPWRVDDGPSYKYTVKQFVWIMIWTVILYLGCQMYFVLGSAKIRKYGVKDNGCMTKLKNKTVKTKAGYQKLKNQGTQ
ncbi:Conserved_hypothetical protein [Hexamita inflata]|uniref:Magnesium transporter n=1 Tax=Hexamita inflata TaxID=28002 RepID=A0AA86PTS9_9EUKA|nr:Conserved hypothetical protein [Hexamita inflata]